MSSIQKTAQGYRAQISINSMRKSKLFATRREAVAWSAQQETELRQRYGDTQAKSHYFTLRKVLERYRDEVSLAEEKDSKTGKLKLRKKGGRWEAVRINAFLKHPEWLPLDSKMSNLQMEHFEAFMKLRQQSVSDGTVLREFGLLGAVMREAKSPWKIINVNPLEGLRKPKEPQSRMRIISASEIRKILRGLYYSPRSPITRLEQATAISFLLALRTGMRSGELCSMTWAMVKGRYIRLPDTKNNSIREVPLSRKALRILNKMKGFVPKSGATKTWKKHTILGISDSKRDADFRTARELYGVQDVTFHDTRHTAATWIAGKLKSDPKITAQQAVLDLCKIFGWRDPKYALVYYNPDPTDLAHRLD